MKKTISITLEEQLIKDLDRLRGHVPRSTFIDLILKGTMKTVPELLKFH